MADTIVPRDRAEELMKLRAIVGEDTYQRLQGEVWQEFAQRIPDSVPAGALHGAWDELIKRLRERVAH